MRAHSLVENYIYKSRYCSTRNPRGRLSVPKVTLWLTAKVLRTDNNKRDGRSHKRSDAICEAHANLSETKYKNKTYFQEACTRASCCVLYRIPVRARTAYVYALAVWKISLEFFTPVKRTIRVGRERITPAGRSRSPPRCEVWKLALETFSETVVSASLLLEAQMFDESTVYVGKPATVKTNPTCDNRDWKGGGDVSNFVIRRYRLTRELSDTYYFSELVLMLNIKNLLNLSEWYIYIYINIRIFKIILTAVGLL